MMNFMTKGARRFALRGNFEMFGRGEDESLKAKSATLPKDKDEEIPPPHAFFTTFASRPVLMTYGLRIFIPTFVPRPGRSSQGLNRKLR